MIEESIVVGRPVQEVFAFYRDLSNLPLFLGDVLASDPLGDDRWRWTIQGPLGLRIHWTIRTTKVVDDSLVAYQVEDTPLAAKWSVSFAPAADGGTLVTERLREPGGGLADAALALVGKHPAAEVRANLARLKQLLETGRVTDRDEAVPGKFEEKTT